MAVLLKWDRQGRLRSVPLTSTEGEELLAGMPEPDRMASWHLVRPGRQRNVPENATSRCHPEIHSAGAAFSPLLLLLPGGTPLARLAGRFPRAAERGYRWVADHRTAFGRLLPGAVKRWADRVISESERDSR